MKRYAIVGGSGQLGSALREELAGRDVLAPAHADLDFERADDVAAFLERERPDVLVNCSAFHNVEQCEREPRRAFEVNAFAVDAAAQRCAERGVAFATVSTDYVFDGTLGRAYREDDATDPLNAYGASKVAGEHLARRHGPRHFIFRTSGVYGRSGTSNKGYTFIERVIRQGENGEPVRVVDDMIFSPSYAPHIARAIVAAIDAEAFGTHHVAGGGACSWYAFARAAFDRLDLGPIEAVSTATFASPVKRPANAPLDSGALARHGVVPPPAWEAGLDAFLEARRERVAAR